MFAVIIWEVLSSTQSDLQTLKQLIILLLLSGCGTFVTLGVEPVRGDGEDRANRNSSVCLCLCRFIERRRHVCTDRMTRRGLSDVSPG